MDVEEFVSRGKNSPLHGQTLRGQVVTTVVGARWYIQDRTLIRSVQFGQEVDHNIRANKLISKAKLILDSNGDRKAVQLEWDTWEELLEFLENIEDSEAIELSRKSGEEVIPWEQAELNHDSQDDAWITDKLNEICAEVDTSLDPAIAAMQWASLRKVEW